jgi:type II secretory pathway pseudopilin PulG
MPQNNSAKFAFFYMLSLVALIFMAVASGMVIFQIINQHIVDIINQYRNNYSAEALKFGISALLISTPIYYLITRQIYKNLFSGALDKDSGVRRWLTYFIIFVAAVVMIVWLISVFNSFLNGELTAKFILKALTALAIAGSIFSFYLYDIKREEVANKKDKVIQIFAYASLAAVIIIFIAGLFNVESPKETRNRKLDQEIINDFNTIARAIDDYFMDNTKLPENLNELQSESNYLMDSDLQDPESKKEYEYKIIENDKYELCATFRTSNKNDEKNKFRYGPFDGFNLHDTGYQCLKNKINIDRLEKTLKEK